VGDDDQSIYSWRGANYENIMQFERDFPTMKEIKLERNYRSTTTILDAANRLIRNNTNRKDKALWSPGGSGGALIALDSPENEIEEAASIARTIKELRIKEGIPNREIGILIRTNNLTKHLEEAMLAENIPYRVSGGTSFFQRKEIKDVISYMRVAANPDDDVNMLRIVNVPRRGVGKKTLETLHDIAKARDCSIYEAMKAARDEGGFGIGEKTVQDMAEFVSFLGNLREDLLGRKHISARVRAMVDAIDYWGYLVSENQHNEKAAKWKFLNVESLIEGIHTWERDPDTHDPGLFQWLNRITLITRDDDSAEDEESKVNLMTIHAAKGLEFDAVFIAGCEDGIIPHARSLEEGEGNVEEERRLFYVAITRAKKRLYISACRKRRKMAHVVECQPSPFLSELPTELVEYREEATMTQEEGEGVFEAMRAKFALVEAEEGEGSLAGDVSARLGGSSAKGNGRPDRKGPAAARAKPAKARDEDAAWARTRPWEDDEEREARATKPRAGDDDE
jgi:DNA helicase-2/ATP-dependent DNA helicase PcrA